MTTSDKIRYIKAMATELQSESEETIEIYLEVARAKIRERLYPVSDGSEKVPEKYALKECEIASYLLLKRGAEGQTAHNENGISRSYENGDVPESIIKGIIPFGRVL